MKKKLKGVDILYMVLLGLCVIMVGIVIGKTRLYDMWNEELICNILHLQQEEQIAEDRHMMEKIQTKILYYTLPQLPDDRMSLYGYVRNANVTIYKDYHIIYQSPEIEEEDGWYFSDTGDYMISVPLKQTDGGKKIQVLVTAGKDEIKNIQFYYGTGEGFMRMILKDEMTGLHNRSAYEEYLMENSKTDAASYVLMMDLNNLKQCNDILGHRVGDDYIMKAAASIRKILEPHGCCYRIGGDEFVVLLLNISKDSFASMLEELQGEWDRIRQQEHRFVFQIAVGYAQASDKTTLQEMIEQADKMMYENKKELKQNAKLYDF